MNKPIRRVAIACLLMFAILLVNDNLVQFADAKSLRNKPGNTRVLYQQFDRKRGDIVTASGVTIATSTPTHLTATNIVVHGGRVSGIATCTL